MTMPPETQGPKTGSGSSGAPDYFPEDFSPAAGTGAGFTGYDPAWGDGPQDFGAFPEGAFPPGGEDYPMMPGMEAGQGPGIPGMPGMPVPPMLPGGPYFGPGFPAMPFPGMMPPDMDWPDIPGEEAFLKDDSTDFKLEGEAPTVPGLNPDGLPFEADSRLGPNGVVMRGRGGPNAPQVMLDLPWYFELIAIVITVLAISSLIRLFLLQPFYIPSQSMEKTLMVDDSVLVNKFSSRHGDINRGDIVVFKDVESWSQTAAEQIRKRPPDRTPFQIATKLKSFGIFVGLLPEDSQGYLIKRVIGVGGDSVGCCNADGLMTINGKAVDEDYIPQTGESSDIDFDVVVPKNSLWVMGDNRPHSADSRWHQDKPSHGFVKESDVVGRAFVVIWPPEHMRFISPSCAFYNIPKPATQEDEDFSSQTEEAPPRTR